MFSSEVFCFPDERWKSADERELDLAFRRVFLILARQTDAEMTRSRIPYIIHGFAMLHALVAFVCLAGGFPDSILLTLLTMTMAVIICIRHGLSVEFTAINVILVNILGFAFGTLGANVFSLFSDNPLVVRPLATAATTEILGWVLHLFARAVEREIPSRSRASRQSGINWLVTAVVVVFILRIFVDIIFSTDLFRGVSMTDLLSHLLNNSAVLLLMIGLTVILVSMSHRGRIRSRYASTAVVVLCIAAISTIGALIEAFGFPANLHGTTTRDFLRILITATLIEVTIFTLSYVVGFAIKMRNEMILQREKTHQAEYRYMTLKQQLNPHFLFNSLNILDSLVADGDRDAASSYIHRLAMMYRYMLRHEGERLVRLDDELTFAEMYWQMLKVRFPDGLQVNFNIPDEDRQRQIVPCTIQLLIENATKHNAISATTPLVINVNSDGSSIRVTNNINPRLTPAVSTGLGHQYIRKQYNDIARQGMEIHQSAESYTIVLPLL